MKIRYLIWAVYFIILFVVPASESFSEDPGIPDTVRFGDWSVYFTGQPDTGEAIASVIVFNDEPIQGFHIPVRWIGPMVCDTAYFAEGRPDVFDWQDVLIDTTTPPWVWFQALSYGAPMAPGTGAIGYMHFMVYDTGWVELDTANTFLIFLRFQDSTGSSWTPIVVPSQYHIVSSLPGDVNQDGHVDLGDVVFLISYLYKGGPPPNPPNCSDVNGDSHTDLGDVVYLISYLYKNGPDPH